MKSSWILGVAFALAGLSAAAHDLSASADAAGSSLATKGKMLITSNGARLGQVYRVGADGSAQMIIDGRLISVPASTLSNVDGRLTTRLSKSEVLALH
ncbi:MAG TPA: hypothetical protein VK437_00840 [Steroidobacteraceae bacterium]|nr:hypothetical protein [Steroidobacteraceae bacterium]